MVGSRPTAAISAFFSLLDAVTWLYRPGRRSVGRSVGLSVGLSLGRIFISLLEKMAGDSFWLVAPFIMLAGRSYVAMFLRSLSFFEPNIFTFKLAIFDFALPQWGPSWSSVLVMCHVSIDLVFFLSYHAVELSQLAYKVVWQWTLLTPLSHHSFRAKPSSSALRRDAIAEYSNHWLPIRHNASMHP